MAHAFSGHLVNSFVRSQRSQPRGPFGQPMPEVVTSGAYAFAPSMHGVSHPADTQASVSLADASFMDISEESAAKIATLQAKLNKKLGPEYISQRPGPGGGPKLTYAEGWKVINLANEVFGFNGWSSNVVSLTTDFIDYNEQSQRYTVGVTAIIKVTLRDGVFHEDIGYGMLENSKSKGAALDKCKKEAVTDGVKRALRNFGNLLGNCLYDKAYAQEVVKIKIPPPKFDKSELHRRPEFAEKSAEVVAGPSSAAAATGVTPRPDTTMQVDTPPQQISSKPISSVPPHMRAMPGSNASRPQPPSGLAEHTTPTPVRTNNAPGTNTGLNTPVQTPAHVSAQRTNTTAMNRLAQIASAVAPKPATTELAKPGPTALQEDVCLPQALDQTTVAAQTEESPPLGGSYDEYGLNSEDDAFLATVDLGEGDSGIGGHIDFEEGAGGPSPIDEESGELPVPAEPKPVAPEPPAVFPRVAQAFRMTAVQALPAQKSANQPAASNPAATPSASSAPRASAPSMGGFHFPTGVSRALPEPFARKRPADAMQASDFRRPMQGMGLSHQPPARREPLATLELSSEGGDLKRARR